jgi:hypothetical protein
MTTSASPPDDEGGFLRSLERLRTNRLHTAVVAFFAFVATLFFTQVSWDQIPTWMHWSAAFIVTLLAEIPLATYLEMKEEVAKVAHFKAQAQRHRVESTQLATHNEKQERALAKIAKYFHTDKAMLMDVLEERHSPHLQAVHARHFAQEQSLQKLLSGQSCEASYKDHYEYADIFAASALAYFWATCLDRVSAFQAKNYHYMTTLAQLPNQLAENPAHDPPSMCRIFVGTIESFYEDICNDPNKWVELYDWHIRWNARATDIYPVRFFVYSDRAEYHRLFRAEGIADNRIIDDFMVVDGGFVHPVPTR